jgi:hypothetical protein
MSEFKPGDICYYFGEPFYVRETSYNPQSNWVLLLVKELNEIYPCYTTVWKENYIFCTHYPTGQMNIFEFVESVL